jgi:hypothetical protein
VELLRNTQLSSTHGPDARFTEKLHVATALQPATCGPAALSLSLSVTLHAIPSPHTYSAAIHQQLPISTAKRCCPLFLDLHDTFKLETACICGSAMVPADATMLRALLPATRASRLLRLPATGHVHQNWALVPAPAPAPALDPAPALRRAHPSRAWSKAVAATARKVRGAAAAAASLMN